MSEAYSISGVAEVKRRGAFSTFLRRLVKEKPLGTFGAGIVVLLLLCGIFADFTWLSWVGVPAEWAESHGLAPYPYDETDLDARLAPPGPDHWLGADHLGRDMLSRVIHGARISMICGLGASVLSGIISLSIGLTSGYIGGKFDIILPRFVDAWITLPPLVIYLTLMSVLGAGQLQIIIVLGVGGGIGGSRGSRALAFWTKNSVYVDAARSIGCSTWRIVTRHLLPNVLPLVIIAFSMGVGGIILAEAGLSFLGFGIPPPVPSWGQMLSAEGRRYMYEAPWMALWPGLALTLAIYGLNMFGDAVRDLLDPRLRGGMGGYGQRGSDMAKKALAKIEAKVRKDLEGSAS